MSAIPAYVLITGAQSRLGCAFFIVSLLAVFGCTAVDSVFGERPVVERELLRACYGPGVCMCRGAWRRAQV